MQNTVWCHYDAYYQRLQLGSASLYAGCGAVSVFWHDSTILAFCTIISSFTSDDSELGQLLDLN